MGRFVIKHILRRPMKTGFQIAVAVFFVLIVGWLHLTLRNIEDEIDRLYVNTIVNAEINTRHTVALDPDIPMMQMINQRTVEAVRSSPFVQDLYIEGGFYWIFVLSDPAASPFDEPFDDVSHVVNPIFAVNSLDCFLEEFSLGVVAELPGVYVYGEDLTLNFGNGWSSEDFVYSAENLDMPIPIIASYHMLEQRGLAVGDRAYIVCDFFVDVREGEELILEAVIIGTHNNRISRYGASHAAVIPLPALELIGRNATIHRVTAGYLYITLKFTINPEYNRQLSAVNEELSAIAKSPMSARAPLALTMHDEELRVVAEQMERDMYLMRLLYPVVVVLTAVISLILYFLLALQNGVNAAIMRALGNIKGTTRAICTTMYIIPLLAGTLLGLSVLLISGGFTLAAVSGAIGGLAGAVTGSVIISQKPPLELLQVKE